MKLITVALLFAAMSANAVEVTAFGVGTTVNRAVADAKNNALEQITGAAIVNQSVTDGQRVRSQSAQYSGGVVRKYELTSTHYDGKLYEVSIVADVDPTKDNNIIAPIEVDLTQQSHALQSAADRYDNVDRIGKSLDNRQAALVAVLPKVEFLPSGEYTTVRVTAGVKLQPKWIDDVRMMSREAGSKIPVSPTTSDILWGIGVATAPFSLVGSSLVRSAANFSTDQQPKHYTASNCFSRDSKHDVDECYAVGYMMGNVVRSDRYLVVVTLWSGNQLVQELPVAVLNNNTLFVLHDDGTRLYFSSSANERKFHSRGVVWFTEGIAIGTNTFQLSTKALATVDRMEYNLK